MTNQPPIEEELREWERLAKEATKGPWIATGHIYGCAIVYPDSAKPGWSDNPGPSLTGKDFTFITAARTGWPRTIAALREALADNERLKQDRADALNVKSSDGLLSSEWLARTGRAERKLSEAEEALSAKNREIERLTKELDAQLLISATVQDERCAEVSKNALKDREIEELRDFVGDIEEHAHTAWKKKARALLRSLDAAKETQPDGM